MALSLSARSAVQAPQNPHDSRSEDCGQRLDQEVVHLAMPARHEILSRLKDGRKCDGKQYGDD